MTKPGSDKTARGGLRALAADPRFIPEIYSYCDRWCERCAFTDRCLNFAMEEAELDRSPGAGDVRNEAFWERLRDILSQTRQMIEELAAQEGCAGAVSAPGIGEERREQAVSARNDPIILAAEQYAQMVDGWFKAEESIEALGEVATLESAGADPATSSQERTHIRIEDLLEVVRWYQHFVFVKLLRAVGGVSRRGGPCSLPKDSDGSAKIALVAIDRSLAAWTQLRETLRPRSDSDSILELLIHLDRLRRSVETAFPNARAFVRPGFDTMPGTT